MKNNLWSIETAPLKKGIFLRSEKFDVKTFTFCKNYKPSALFLETENLASHEYTLKLAAQKYNVLPKYLFINCNYQIFDLPEGATVRLDNKKQILIHQKGVFPLIDQYRKLSKELLAWKYPSFIWRCDRPESSYPIYLQKIIRHALKESAHKIGINEVNIQFDSVGRLWTFNYPSPENIVKWIVKNPYLYLKFSHSFIVVLEHYLKINNSTPLKNISALCEEYYKYIRFFSSTPSIFFTLLNENDINIKLNNYFLFFNTKNNKELLTSFKYFYINLINIKDHLEVIKNEIQSMNLKKEDYNLKLIKKIIEVALLVSDAKHYTMKYIRENNKFSKSLKPLKINKLPINLGELQ